MNEQEQLKWEEGYAAGYNASTREFEPVRQAAKLFERAANDWMERALRAERELEKLNVG